MTDHTFTITLPGSFVVRGEGKEAIRVPFADLAGLDDTVRNKVLSDAFIGGFLTVMTNTYNSGGKDMSVADRTANLKRRLDAFLRGEWVSRGGPRDSLEGDMRDAFYIEKGAQDEATRRKIDKDIKALVAEVFGKDEPARFGTFLKAVATSLAKKRVAKDGPDRVAMYDDLLAKLTAKYEAAAEALRTERAKATSSINIDDLI
jgi:hypothetical protein